MHRDEIPLPPRRLNPTIPESLEEITLKVLSKEPSARYRTADQLGRVLLSFGHLNQDKTGPIVLPQTGNAKPSSHLEFSEPPIGPDAFPQYPDSYDEPEEDDTKPNPGIDWATWGLGLLAFTAVLGLIPFWLFIYLSFRP